jgi:hypothetical protein
MFKLLVITGNPILRTMKVKDEESFTDAFLIILDEIKQEIEHMELRLENNPDGYDLGYCLNDLNIIKEYESKLWKKFWRGDIARLIRNVDEILKPPELAAIYKPYFPKNYKPEYPPIVRKYSDAILHFVKQYKKHNKSEGL